MASSPAPGDGSGASPSDSTSGPPGAEATTTRTSVVELVGGVVHRAVVGDVHVDADDDRIGSAGRAVPALGERLRPRSEALDPLRVGLLESGGVPEDVGRDGRRL